MVVKVYGIIISVPTQVVLLTLKQLGVPYEFIVINGAEKEHKSPAYMAKHPFGQIPLLEDDDFILFESRAIARYLVEKYGPDSGLIPKGLKEKAIFEQAASIEVANFSQYTLGLAAEKFFKPVFGNVPEDEVKAAEHQKTLEEKLKAYDVILGKQKYIAGDNFTLIDLFHIPSGAAAIEHGGFKGFDKYPNVKRWWDDISSRSKFKEIWLEVEAFKATLKQ